MPVICFCDIFFCFSFFLFLVAAHLIAVGVVSCWDVSFLLKGRTRVWTWHCRKLSRKRRMTQKQPQTVVEDVLWSGHIGLRVRVYTWTCHRDGDIRVVICFSLRLEFTSLFTWVRNLISLHTQTYTHLHTYMHSITYTLGFWFNLCNVSVRNSVIASVNYYSSCVQKTLWSYYWPHHIVGSLEIVGVGDSEVLGPPVWAAWRLSGAGSSYNNFRADGCPSFWWGGWGGGARFTVPLSLTRRHPSPFSGGQQILLPMEQERGVLTLTRLYERFRLQSTHRIWDIKKPHSATPFNFLQKKKKYLQSCTVEWCIFSLQLFVAK